MVMSALLASVDGMTAWFRQTNVGFISRGDFVKKKQTTKTQTTADYIKHYQGQWDTMNERNNFVSFRFPDCSEKSDFSESERQIQPSERHFEFEAAPRYAWLAHK